MFWTAVTEGLMVAPLHLTKVGPPGQHGGEVVLEAGKSLLYGGMWPKQRETDVRSGGRLRKGSWS